MATMRVHRLAAPAMLAAAILLMAAACSGTPSGSAGASAAASPAAVLHDFPRLEAIMPVKIGGKTLQTTSSRTTPAQLDARTAELLRRLGKTGDDVQVALANGPGVNLQVYALRISGADAKQALADLKAIDLEGGEPLVVDVDTTVAGKNVVRRTVAATETVQYMYPVADVLFAVQGSSQLVQEAIGQLP